MAECVVNVNKILRGSQVRMDKKYCFSSNLISPIIKMGTNLIKQFDLFSQPHNNQSQIYPTVYK